MDFLTKIIDSSLVNAEVILISSIFIAFAWYFLFLRHRCFMAASMLFLGGVSLGYLGGVRFWLSGLGGDSFLEVVHLDEKEAYFWASTFLSLFSQMRLPVDKTSLLIVIEVVLLSVLLFFGVWWRPIVLRALMAALIAGLFYFSYLGYAGFELGRLYVADLQHEFDPNPYGFEAMADIDLLVYIGESTSSLNMSLYGYPLPTTPRLDRLFQEDVGFLRFNRVRSTHTHTSPSLMRALAISAPLHSDGYRKKWGIGGVLKQSGLAAKLYSVQPLNGSFATFSRFLFDGLLYDLNEADRYKGNLIVPKVKDHQLLEQALKDSGVVFFHSYAGHGNYLEKIDTNLSSLVKKPQISFRGLYGSLFSERFNSDLAKNANDYDQAITYIDRNVSHAIETLKFRRKPAVMIYFSDHGESVFAGRGHDSSNYIEEMTTVPVVFYFNQAYRGKYPEIVEAYRKAALSGHAKILDQIAPSILDVLRVQSEVAIDVPTLASSSKHPRPYILERDTASGSSRIDLEYDEKTGFGAEPFFNGGLQDDRMKRRRIATPKTQYALGGALDPTYISIINEKFGRENTICYQRANSYAKALRAAAVSNCIEFDLMVDEGDLNVYHPSTVPTGLQLEHIFRIAQARKNSLWIASTSLDNPLACNKLASYLEANHDRVGQILVEFPGRAVERLSDLRSCIQRLKAVGARTSYHVPRSLFVSCPESSSERFPPCGTLNDTLREVIASEIFSDLSFDYSGYPAMKSIRGAENMKWNTRAIKAQDFNFFPRRDFGFVIMDTSTDPNTY